MTHPHRDPVLRVRCGKAGQHLAPLLQQDLGTAPIGRRLQTGELDGAGKAQPGIHRGRDEFAVGIGGRNARHCFGVADHEVIAALGLERRLVAQCRGERFRIGAGADNRSIGSEVAGVGLDRGESAAIEAKTVRPRPDQLAARDFSGVPARMNRSSHGAIAGR